MTAADRVVVALGAALVGALFAALWRPSAPAAWVEVRSGSQLVGRYALDAPGGPQKLEVHGQLGVSVIELGAGRARFAAGPCRNRVCVHSGWLSRDGAVAACLPNRVTLALAGGAPAAFDAIAY